MGNDTPHSCAGNGRERVDDVTRRFKTDVGTTTGRNGVVAQPNRVGIAETRVRGIERTVGVGVRNGQTARHRVRCTARSYPAIDTHDSNDEPVRDSFPRNLLIVTRWTRWNGSNT